ARAMALCADARSGNAWLIAGVACCCVTTVHLSAFDAGGLDDLAPLLGLLDQHAVEVVGRAGKRRTAALDEPRLHRRIAEAAFTSRLSRSTIPRGVSRGAPIPVTALAS